ncbi:MAG: CYTH domain-containing protein [Litorilituus sp.]|jgi:triphosphatase|nr:CYTH domain-containing protein [Litorilituus sp.]
MKKLMSAEIELKYLLPENNNKNDQVADKISAMLSANKVDFIFAHKQLCNDYFDTPTLELRKMDVGLRIRTVENNYEQTIKTSGTVVDGLHQRPEFNVNIPTKQLELSLFPVHVWPEGVDLSSLHQKLRVIFSTHFTRKTWLIKQGENVIELALDNGDICVDNYHRSFIISEIEIELVRGKQQALFELATQLKNIINITPGNLSKAARGYRLYYEKLNK